MRFSPRATDDHSLAPFQLANGIGFGTCDPILDHVVGIILVLSEIIPRCALDLFSIDGKQIAPRVYLNDQQLDRNAQRRAGRF